MLVIGACDVICCSVAVFNVGEYRRNMTGCETVGADFFQPTNDEARLIRELVHLVHYIHCTVLYILYVWLSFYLYLV